MICIIEHTLYHRRSDSGIFNGGSRMFIQIVLKVVVTTLYIHEFLNVLVAILNSLE